MGRFQQHRVATGFQIEDGVLLYPALLPVYLQHKVAAGPADALQGKVQQREEVFRCHRFHEVAEGRDFVALKDVARVVGEEGQRDPGVRLPDFPGKVQAAQVSAAQVDVQQEQVEGVAACCFEEQFLAAGEGFDEAGVVLLFAPAVNERFQLHGQGGFVVAKGDTHRWSSSLVRMICYSIHDFQLWGKRAFCAHSLLVSVDKSGGICYNGAG